MWGDTYVRTDGRTQYVNDRFPFCVGSRLPSVVFSVPFTCFASHFFFFLFLSFLPLTLFRSFRVFVFCDVIKKTQRLGLPSSATIRSFLQYLNSTSSRRPPVSQSSYRSYSVGLLQHKSHCSFTSSCQGAERAAHTWIIKYKTLHFVLFFLLFECV